MGSAICKTCRSLDTACVSRARENERTADGRLAVGREIEAGLSYYFAIPRSMLYSLVPGLKALWLVWCVTKEVVLEIPAAAPLSVSSMAWGSHMQYPPKLHQWEKELSATVPS